MKLVESTDMQNILTFVSWQSTIDSPILITSEACMDGGVTVYPLRCLSLQYNTPSTATALLQLKLRSVMPEVWPYITLLSQSCFTLLN